MLTHIRPADLPQWLAQHTAAAQALPVVLDVREPWEVQTASVSAQGFELRCLPMSSLAQRWQEIPTDRAIACLCHHGGRSAQVATFLQTRATHRWSTSKAASTSGPSRWTPALPAIETPTRMTPSPLPHLVQRNLPGVRRAAGWALWLACALGAAPLAQAQSLPDLLQAARQHDASFRAAQAQLDAQQARAAQARAGVLPRVGLGAGVQLIHTDSTLPGPERSTTQARHITLQATQPLYRPANRLAQEQAQQSLLAAQAQWNQAEQALVMRTAQAFFAVLAAQDRLALIQAQQKAVEQQRLAAQRQFEVGSATITDVREAQARLDLVLAQQVAADNALRIQRLALDQLTGRAHSQPWRLRPDAQLPELKPEHIDAWVERAHSLHPGLQQRQALYAIATLETQRAQAERRPTLDATAQYQISRGFVPAANRYARQGEASVGLQLQWPLYAGGALQQRVSETLALQEQARHEWEAAQREVAQATRSAFLGVVSHLGQVRALQAAQDSSWLALQANQLGYQVGVRINIDVLNAQNQWFQAQTALAQARYDVLLGHLLLRQASGVLTAQDLDPINALLTPP